MTGGHRIRLGLEAGFDPGWPAGLMYVRNLVYALASVPPDKRAAIRLLPVTAETVGRISDLAAFDGVSIAAPRWSNARAAEASLLFRRAKRRFVQPLFGRALDKAFEGLDVTYPDFGRPLPRVPQMHWIPDLQHVHLPHLFDERELETRNLRVAAIARSDDIVVLSSEAARADLFAFSPDLTARARVWRFCTTLTDAEKGGRDPHSAYGIPQHFFYVANQFWAHKEHLTLFEALRMLRSRGERPAVVCTGPMHDPRDPDYVPRIVAYLKEHELDEQVKLLGVIPRNDQIQVLRHCAAVIQPSRFEGWSTVLEDAKALGRPAIASDIDVHREQVPEQIFFRVGSPESLAEVIAENLGELAPGPDDDAEERAAAAAEVRRREAGRIFMDIAAEGAASG